LVEVCRQNVCSILACLKVLNESKTMCDDQNFMPFLNMNSEILSLFFLRVLTKGLKVGLDGEQTGFC
jgi:hypothetical protein